MDTVVPSGELPARTLPASLNNCQGPPPIMGTIAAIPMPLHSASWVRCFHRMNVFLWDASALERSVAFHVGFPQWGPRHLAQNNSFFKSQPRLTPRRVSASHQLGGNKVSYKVRIIGAKERKTEEHSMTWVGAMSIIGGGRIMSETWPES